MGWKGVPVEGALWLANAFSRRAKDPTPETTGSILVLRPNDLGDLLTTTPIFEALRNRFPKSKIVAGVGHWGRPVLEKNPFVDEVVELNVPWNNKVISDQSWKAVFNYLSRAEAIEAIKQRHAFGIGIDITGSHVGVALLMRLGIPYRVGVRGYRGGWSACQRYIRFSDEVSVAGAALAQAELLGARELPEARPQIYLTDAERLEASSIWQRLLPEQGIRVLVGCGGGLEEKCWPSDRLGTALKMLAELMTEAGLGKPNILLCGGKSDLDRASRILAASGPEVRSVCGETSLRITFGLAATADVVLTNSSMLLHAGAAFHKAIVAVIGGMNHDVVAHDRLWGYPPPYVSVGPAGSEDWPSVDRVVAALFQTAKEYSFTVQ